MRITTDKKNILIFFAAPILVCAAYMLLVFALDPFALFHARGIKIGVLDNMRIQAASAINSADFDSIILGTSVLENTSAKEASDLLGGKFINLSISGSTFYERSIILDYAFRKKKLKRVVYSMDAVYTNPVYEIENYPASRYDFLYNNDAFDNIRAYFDFSIAGCILKNVFGSACMSRDYDYDRPNAWMNLPEHMGRFGGLQNWLRAENNHQIVDALSTIARDIDRVRRNDLNHHSEAEIGEAIDTALEYVNADIITYVKNNPETQFDLVFPPYSRIVYAQWYQLQPLDVPVHQALLRYLVGRLAELPNLAIYGYEDMDFLDDIANYKDTVHYNPTYNSRMLEWIKGGEHRLTPRNIGPYLEISEKKAKAFDLGAIGTQVDAYLKKKKAP